MSSSQSFVNITILDLSHRESDKIGFKSFDLGP